MPGKQLKYTTILAASILAATVILPQGALAQPDPAELEAEEPEAETDALEVEEGKIMHVRDQIFVPFRSGPTNQYRIIRFLPTGSQLETKRPDDEVIEQFGEEALEEWIYGTHGNDEGWVQAQYMVEETPARMRIGDVEADLESAHDEIAALEDELADKEQAKEELNEDLAEARQQIADLESDLEAASDGYRLVQENDKLKERIHVLIERTENLEERNQELADRANRDWFLAGSGVLVGGLLLGLILPHLRPRRKGWGSSL
ncbi:TIGR04211 family SH3 domain-containing protein [Halorhodospira halochloris]|uniref:TIGR04211 family SH3 domain-containing protein n=1 Tax=Halorhodospira halochloris TaxID=1052 RepID=UPI001EE9631E|nr:TIGR04211 family SH3 domain-containing protein [Halorhodospira halochloris]MCG5548196.1 TIGR04211 family SH3 domain-containing protein [Halorhodospira halochloris]